MASQGSSRSSQAMNSVLKAYNKRLHDNVRAMLENFSLIIQSAKIEDIPQVQRETQGYFDIYQMKIRAANIVRAGESLLKLISDLKTFVILNDFPSINEHINEQNNLLNKTHEELFIKLRHLQDDFCSTLYDMETEYYNGLKLSPATAQ